MHSGFFAMMQFFSMMNEVPDLRARVTVETSHDPLAELKEVATLLLDQPEPIRRNIIATYDLLVKDDYESSIKLYILLRLLFDVPEAYPVNDADLFYGGGWVMLGEDWNDPTYPSEGLGTVNLLWPLGYRGDKLILEKVIMWRFDCFGCTRYYKGLDAYDYFAVRFPRRSMDELGEGTYD